MKTGKNRYVFLDQLRGIAIVLMIIFHFFYDLNFYKFVQIDFFSNKLWYYFPRLITFMFLSCVGISLGITHEKKVYWKKVGKRFLILGFWATTISIATYFTFPTGWIYFGILHCIALSSIVTLIFLKIPTIAGLSGIVLLILGVFYNINLPWIHLPHPAMDSIPFFPWFGAVLFGLFLKRIELHRLKTDFKILSPISYLGKHSLIIYLIHQPLLFGLVSGVWWALHHK